MSAHCESVCNAFVLQSTSDLYCCNNECKDTGGKQPVKTAALTSTASHLKFVTVNFIICTTKHQEAYIQYTDQANANEVRGRDQYLSDVTLHHKN